MTAIQTVHKESINEARINLENQLLDVIQESNGQIEHQW